ncbi:hypothetical protein Dimus_027544 [Dionaea muscipula]
MHIDLQTSSKSGFEFLKDKELRSPLESTSSIGWISNFLLVLSLAVLAVMEEEKNKSLLL